MIRVIGAFYVVTLINSLAFAGPLEIFPDGPSNMNSVIFDNPRQEASETADLQIRTHVDCYGTNLRSVSNPLSPSATLLVHVDLDLHDDVWIKFPAKVFFPFLGPYNPAEIMFHAPNPVPAGWSIRFDPPTQLIVAQTTHTVASGSVDGSGNIQEDHRPLRVNDVRIRQIGIGVNGQFLGSDGPVSGHFSFRVSTDGRILSVYANYPGQNGFCGGYYSPLMVFFDEKRPTFQGKSQFPLMPMVGWVSWPEVGAPGYFVVHDQNKDGKITTSSELFSSRDFKNGFEALRVLDANNDGVIDKKDPKFGELQLWKDSNGDGISEKKELLSLGSKGLESISLKYGDQIVTSIGGVAEARERSTFTFRKKGKSVKGEIIDYWFSPRISPEALATTE